MMVEIIFEVCATFLLYIPYKLWEKSVVERIKKA